MTTSATAKGASRGRRLPRILGRYDTGRPGPTFVVTAGIHGNEPGGIVAGRRVLKTLEASKLPLRGRFLVLVGNIAALASEVRYFDTDLNRLWTPELVRTLLEQEPDEDLREQREQRELLGVIEAQMRGAEGGDFVLIDLHSSSGDGAPFVCMGDTLRNRKIAFALPVPVILGLEETIDGALLDWVYELGHIAVAVEGGRHDAASTADNLEASVWLALIAAGSLSEGEVPDLAKKRDRLAAASRGIARVLEIRHREELFPQDEFCMEPGYSGFDRVAKGQLLAKKNGAEVRAHEDCRILLPLYQGQGNDGFFLARRVLRFWLALSAVMRRVRFSRFLPLFPGVRRHETIEDAFVSDPGRAPYRLRTGLFRLLGYRRKRRQGEHEIFTRRRER